MKQYGCPFPLAHPGPGPPFQSSLFVFAFAYVLAISMSSGAGACVLSTRSIRFLFFPLGMKNSSKSQIAT
jgi:hypothetical protein